MSTKPVRIGFYSQIPAIGEEIYPIVSEEGSLQLHEGIGGTFVMGSYQRFYVAAVGICDGEIAQVGMNVDVVIPNVPTQDERPRKITFLQVGGCDCHCRYPLYKSRVVNMTIVNSFLNPNLEPLYAKIVETYVANSLPAPPPASPITASSLSLLQDSGFLTFYTFIRGRISTIGDVSFILPEPTRFIAYTNTNNLFLQTNAFPDRAGYVRYANSIEYLGINISNLTTDIGIFYDITINNTAVRGVQPFPSVCVVAYSFLPVKDLGGFTNGYPVEITVNGSPVGNDHTWIPPEIAQGPLPPTTRITNIGGTPLRIPVSFTNFVLVVRAGVTTSFRQFEQIGPIVDLTYPFTGFINFNRIFVQII